MGIVGTYMQGVAASLPFLGVEAALTVAFLVLLVMVAAIVVFMRWEWRDDD